MTKNRIALILMILFVFLTSCNNHEYLQVKKIKNGIDDFGEVFNTNQTGRSICVSDENITIECFDCEIDIIQLCRIGKSMDGKLRCWC